MSLPRILLVLALACALHALQLQDVELISPTEDGRRFIAVVPAGKTTAPGPADMGTDVDGCRHSSGPCEYDYFVVVDPFSYFAALSSEWDQRSGRFASEIPREVIEWARKEWNSDREIDWNQAFQYTLQVARATGNQPPDRAQFVIAQNSIPVEKRYRLALAAYQKRGARHAVLAKIALTGAWALRVRLQLPVSHPSLAGGFEEVNSRIASKIKDGETFDLPKWTEAYRQVVDRDGLTREGYCVAASALFGFLMRQGDNTACRELLAKAGERLGQDKDDKPDMLRGLIRDRKRVMDDHHRLLGVAAEQFTAALRAEEFVRQRIPIVLLTVAEAYRRSGNLERAADWYTALARLPETQPAVREALRNEGRQRALPEDKPTSVQLGWIADEQLQLLRKAGLAHAGEFIGPDRGLLVAVVNEGLGTAAYNVPGWKPVSGANANDCARVLDQVGKAVLDHAFRLGAWPKNLGELWESEVLRDRNQVNRFHCPASGKPFTYAVPPGNLENIAPTTVLVATSAPVETPQGPRYAAFQANTKLAWLEQPPVVGQPLPRP